MVGWRNSSGSSTNLYGFTGYEADAESGMNYATFRNESPSLGRFSRPDPYDGSYDLTDPQSLNRYSYVGDRPLIFVDPTGLHCSNFTVTNSDGTTTQIEGDDGTGGGCQDGESQIDGSGNDGNPDQISVGDDGSPPLSDSIGPIDMTLQAFITMMNQAGFKVSFADTFTLIHDGTQMRDKNPFCSIHIVLDPRSGQYGAPITGTFHTDFINPFTGQDGFPKSMFEHAGVDVVPDIIQDLGFPNMPTGSGNCK